MTNLEHVNVKIFAGGPVDFTAVVPVFHRWIQENACEELLIDVASYRHVPAGPGVLLVGHEADYSLDNRGNRPGLLYNRKAPVEASAAGKIAQAFRAAALACRRLEAAPEFAGRLRFNAGELEITINDRLLAPNTEENYAALREEMERALAPFFGPVEWAFEAPRDARERLRVRASAGRFIPIEEVAAAVEPAAARV